MNKRRILIIATTFLLASTIMTSATHSEFSTPEVRITDNTKEIAITEDVEKPLTAILPAKEVNIKDIKNTIVFDGKVYSYKKVNIIATYYTNSVADCGNTKGITASGVRASRGGVAVPQNIPFGTEIILEDEQGSKQKVVANDRGGAIRWIDNNTMKIDVFVPNATKKQLLKLGVKHYTGYIVEE